MRGGKFISGNNFSAQEHASSKTKHILNFRVKAVRDMKRSVEKYIRLFFSQASERAGFTNPRI